MLNPKRQVLKEVKMCPEDVQGVGELTDEHRKRFLDAVGEAGKRGWEMGDVGVKKKKAKTSDE
jgi:hypothetical protein